MRAHFQLLSLAICGCGLDTFGLNGDSNTYELISTDSGTAPSSGVLTEAATFPLTSATLSGIETTTVDPDTTDTMSVTTGPKCGDGACEAGETPMSCPDDCEAPPSCGNGTCEPELEEDANTCDVDCDSVCGNGVQEKNEDCDDGNDVETDACLSTCINTACGDGFVQAGVEACDDGDDDDTDECVAMCKVATCGDGFVQNGVDECDDMNNVDDDGCSSMCKLPRRRVFVTSTYYKGNLGGLSGADAKCQTHAEGLTPAGMFKAWLSDSTGNPATRFDAGLNGFAGLYVLVNGTMVAAGWDDLTDGTLINAIGITENGDAMEGEQSVWTNTDPEGLLLDASKHCTNWTVNTGGGNLGRIGYSVSKLIDWTKGSELSCLYQLPIYCIEDPG